MMRASAQWEFDTERTCKLTATYSQYLVPLIIGSMATRFALTKQIEYSKYPKDVKLLNKYVASTQNAELAIINAGRRYAKHHKGMNVDDIVEKHFFSTDSIQHGFLSNYIYVW